MCVHMMYMYTLTYTGRFPNLKTIKSQLLIALYISDKGHSTYGYL